jgi:hypothetical protein
MSLTFREFANTPPEVHALGWGLYRGLTSRPLRTPPAPDIEDVHDEPHYYRGGYVSGTVLRVGVLLVVVWVALSTG